MKNFRNNQLNKITSIVFFILLLLTHKQSLSNDLNISGKLLKVVYSGNPCSYVYLKIYTTNGKNIDIYLGDKYINTAINGVKLFKWTESKIENLLTNNFDNESEFPDNAINIDLLYKKYTFVCFKEQLNCGDDPYQPKEFFLKKIQSITNNTPSANLPFIGKRWFEIQNGMNGTGTPQYYIEITQNGDTYIGYIQKNQANGKSTSERVLTGKYQKHIKVRFKGEQDYYYYTIENNYIYELEENYQKLKATNCCDYSEEDTEKECECRGLLEKR